MKRKIFGYAISTIILIALWYLLGFLVRGTLRPNQAHFFPPPHDAFIALFSNLELYLGHFWGTMHRLLISIGIALSLAVPIGLFIGYKQWAKKLFTPLLYTIYPIPLIIFWPVLFLILGYLMGYEELARILFITMIIFFQLLISVRDATANLPRDYITTALVSGVRPLRMYKDVLLPGTLPNIFSSLRISIGLGLFASYVAEASFRPGNQNYFGLGYHIDASFPFSSKGMWAGILAIAILGVTLYLILELLERRFCRWKQLEIDSDD